MVHITLQMNRTAIVVHKLQGKTNELDLQEQVKHIISVQVISTAQVFKFFSVCNLKPFLPTQLLHLGAYSLMKPECSGSFNKATFHLTVLCSSASTVLTAAAPPKGSVYGLWILHAGLYTTEFGKTISDTLFTGNCNSFLVQPCSI